MWLECVFPHDAKVSSRLCPRVYGGRIRPLATDSREIRQVRKGATVAVRLGAGMWWVRFAAQFYVFSQFYLSCACLRNLFAARLLLGVAVRMAKFCMNPVGVWAS